MANSSFARLTSSPGLFQSNLSFYAVPAAWALSLLPHVYAIALYNKERAPDTAEWDMALPGKNISHVKDGKLSPAMQDRFLRAEAANNNSFVGLPLFAGAIIAGNMARIPASTLNAFALTYLGFRTAFVVLYVNGTTKALANARFASWLGASFTCLTLFVKAGNQFRRALAL